MKTSSATPVSAAAAPGAPSPDDALARYTAQARQIILARQDPHTGLLPASTAITVHGDYTHAWVRDNVYSILAIWALSLAHRTRDPEVAQALGERVEALMRGLLAAMMRQVHKVERFKHTQHSLDALHAKYDTRSGEPVVGDAEWGHLQIDATAIFLLQLAQMSASGLRIVREVPELHFVQNLVHYLARAYRTPDYGIWERGHKSNLGRAEINASSVGMAKAALEAINGFEPLPGAAPRVLVQGDDVAHMRTTLAGLLPRESVSKETDAALLSIIGYPAFAVDDAQLAQRTRTEIVDKLQGRYGCKRFLRDGHQTVLEDHSRLHYEPGELHQFEHIESEWPLFFCYLLVDAVLRGDAAAAADYRGRLDALMQTRDGQALLPELFVVPAESVEAERAQPHSQTRVPNDNLPLVWAQSLYLVGVLLQEGWLDAAALDPLGRRRCGAPAGADAPPAVCVQVALLASDPLVQAHLGARGIAAQTLAEVAPVQVRYADELDAALAELGRDDSLGLSGRPRQRPGSLATSLVYRHAGQAQVFLPAVFNRQSFYLSLDNRLLIDEIQAELADLRQHWREPGQPLLLLWITAPMLQAAGAEGLMDFLRQLCTPDPEAGDPQGAPALPTGGVATGALSTLLPLCTVRELDWLTALPGEATLLALRADAAAALGWEEAATRALGTERQQALAHTDIEGLQATLARSRNPYEQIETLGLLWQRVGPETPTWRGGSVRELTEAVYARAGHERLWGVVRRAAGVLDVHDETLEDAVAQIVVRQMQVSMGRVHEAQAIVDAPLGNAELFERLRRHGGEDARARVLIQETVLLLSTLLKADARLFAGVLTLRPTHLLQLIGARLVQEHGLSPHEAFNHLLDCSPQALLGRLRELISQEQALQRELAAPPAADTPAPTWPPEVPGWAAWRALSGALGRVPDHFHERVWALLRHFKGLVIGDANDGRQRLDAALARADTTPGERSFALQVEHLLNQVDAPIHRQLQVEALIAVSEPSLWQDGRHVDAWLALDTLITAAVHLGWAQQSPPLPTATDQQDADDAQAWAAFHARPPHEVAALFSAALQPWMQAGGTEEAATQELHAEPDPALDADAEPVAAPPPGEAPA